jgi:hypothetical protein
MKDFNIAKYLKENKLGPHAILGGYVDLHNLKEEEETKLDTEIPYEGPEHKLDGFGDEFQQANPVEEKAGKDDKDSLMSKLFAIQKKYGYKKARPDQEEYENVRIAPTVARVGNKIVEDGGIVDSIESKVSKAAFTDIKNLLQSKFPGWQIDPQSVTKDDDFDTDSKNVLFFDIVKNKSVKEDSPVEELEKPERIYSDEWMNDSVDGKRVGSWTCYYEGHLGVLYWVHDDIPGEHVTVYATPNWDDAKGTAIEVQLNSGEEGTDYATIGEPSYPDFESYAQDMVPVLKKVEAKYKAGKYNDYIDYGDSMDTDDSVNPFPSIMKEKEDNSMTGDKGWEYDDEDDYDRFADLGGNQIKSAIKSLMDDGFDSREIAQFVVDTIRGFKSFKEEVTVSSSGVQMEGEEFKWTARDQQGKLHGILYVKPMGDTLMVTADDGMPGTKYTKADIADAMGRGEFIRFRGKDLALDTRMKAWANS